MSPITSCCTRSHTPTSLPTNPHSGSQGASDIIITKAGPGTIAEALICGLPMLLNGYIPCQEEGNIPYVLENQVGAFSQDVREISDKVICWFLVGGLRGAALATWEWQITNITAIVLAAHITT